MGVHGLWKLIEPSGKVVPLETLEGKVLAVDISIWLHQAIKGYQDSRGAPIPNAHLLTLYRRVCKLLYFRIKPVFIFDGGVPALKKETINRRNQLKSKNFNEVNHIQKQLINTLLKHSAVSKVLSEKTKAELGSQAKRTVSNVNKNEGDDLFLLPSSQTNYESSDSEEYDSTSGTSDASPTKYFNIHDIDEKSVQFQNLPADVRHEILTDLKETRKQNSWGRIHELPKESDGFSTYQMKRLLKRYSIQTCLEDAEKEMGGASLSLNELESLLNDHGVITEDKGNRIASDENTRYLYIKDVKKTLEKAKIKELKEESKDNLELTNINEDSKEDGVPGSSKKLDSTQESESEFEENLETAIKLSLEQEKTDDETEKPSVEKEKIANFEQLKEKIGNFEQLAESTKHDVEFQKDLEAAMRLSLQQEKTNNEKSPIGEEKISNIEQLSESMKHDAEFQKDLEAAMKLSLQDIPSTSQVIVDTSKDNSSSGDVTSSNTTPSCSQEVTSENEFSTYLKTLRDSDFLSSDENDEEISDNIILQEQKATQKVFSAAKSYMMEYGGLTQAGIEEIFGSNETNLRPQVKLKRKHVSFDPEVNTLEFMDKSSNDEEIITSTGELNNENLEKTKEDEIELMSDSESNSDDDFIEISPKQKEENKTFDNDNGIKISFNTKDEIVDDIFKDIFENSSEEIPDKLPTKNPTEIINKTPENNKESSPEVAKTNEKEPDESQKVENQQEINQPTSTKENIPEKSSDLLKSASEYKVTVEGLLNLKATLSEASKDLLNDRGKKERLAGNISDQMYQEAQQLLTLFGIPFIVAPMEAEAQCAFLNEINLTDGTITDDSDIWLFGGKIVYKNFFNQDRHVLEFKADSIQHHFKLSRHQLISLAMLVGSDYTIGIQGIGPVTALEVLAAFPSKNNFDIITTLESFREWFTSGKKVHGRGKAQLRNKLKNIVLHEGFPSSNVSKAYLEPSVDSSKEAFTWGKPDLQSVIDYCKDKFGWTTKKVTETLDPVLRRLSDNKPQKRIQDYFKSINNPKLNTSIEIQNKLSKRVKKALGNIEQGAQESSDDEVPKTQDEFEAVEVLKKTRKLSKKKNNEIMEDVASKLKILEKRDLEMKKISENNLEMKKPRLANLHKKEVIPQKEKEKSNLLQNKLKAIEKFRKSSKGPGFVKKRTKVIRKPKEDAGLSEGSSDE